MGCKGKGPEKAKRPPARPAIRTPTCSPCSSENGPGRCRAVASTRHRPPERVDAAGVGRIAAGHPRRQKLLEHIWQRTSLSRKQFASFVPSAPLERYAELVQAFPASEAHHHAYPGGMLDHGLEIVAYSLKLRQSHLLPIGANPETGPRVRSLDRCRRLRRTAARHRQDRRRSARRAGRRQHLAPLARPLRQPYRFRYRDDREYRLHSAATGLLYRQLLDRESLDWLSGYPSCGHHCSTSWRAVQARRGSGRACRAGRPAPPSPRNWAAIQARAMAAPSTRSNASWSTAALPAQEELKLNQPEASDGWLTEDALWLVSKTVSDKLRAHLLSQGSMASCEQHRRVQRATGSRHVAARKRRRGAENAACGHGETAALNGQKLPSWEGSSTVTASTA